MSGLRHGHGGFGEGGQGVRFGYHYPPMFRRLFTVLSALSLAAFVATAVLWLRSRRTTDAVEFQRDGVRWRIASDAGRLRLDNEPQRRIEQAAINRERVHQRLQWRRAIEQIEAALARMKEDSDQADPAPPVYDESYWVRRAEKGKAERRRIDAMMAMLKTPSPTLQRPAPLVAKSVPHALAAAATAALPAAWLGAVVARALRTRSRRTNNRCLRCGYDLRATPGRCPECGAEPQTRRW